MTTTRKARTARLHIDPTTGATVLDGTTPKEASDMLTANGTVLPDHSAELKAKQAADRKAANAAAAAKVAPKATGTTRAVKIAPAQVAPKAKVQKAVKQTVAKSKASRVRDLLDQGKTVRECADALKEFGVTWAYAWDVAAAYEKKTGKVFIPSHAPAKAKTKAS